MAQAGSNDEKNGGQKSRWTVPLKSMLITYVPKGSQILINFSLARLDVVYSSIYQAASYL